MTSNVCRVWIYEDVKPNVFRLKPDVTTHGSGRRTNKILNANGIILLRQSIENTSGKCRYFCSRHFCCFAYFVNRSTLLRICVFRCTRRLLRVSRKGRKGTASFRRQTNYYTSTTKVQIPVRLDLVILTPCNFFFSKRGGRCTWKQTLKFVAP